jgi:hypothetical protein
MAEVVSETRPGHRAGAGLGAATLTGRTPAGPEGHGCRWARYQLAWRTSSAKGRSARADRRPQLLVALGNEILSRSELVARTGLSDQTVGSD